MARILKYNESKLQILRLIRERNLKVGDKLPAERELVALLGVSIISVHRALEELRAGGVIRTVQGVGSFLETAVDGTQTTSLLGLVSIGCPGPDYNHMYQLEKAAEKYNLSYRCFYVERELNISLLDEMRRCDRFILTGFVNDQWLSCIGSFNRPMIQFGDSVHSYPVSRVAPDWEACFRKSVEVLRKRDCRKIAFLIPDPQYNAHAPMMYDLAIKVLSAFGLPIDYSIIRFIPRDHAIEPLLELLLSCQERIDAFITIEPGSLLPLLMANVATRFLDDRQLAVIEGRNYLPLDTEKCCKNIFRVYHGEPLLGKAVEILYTYPCSFIENYEIYRGKPEVFV